MTKMKLGLIQEEGDQLGKGQGSGKELTIEILIGKSKMDLHGTKGEQVQIGCKLTLVSNSQLLLQAFIGFQLGLGRVMPYL
jgi:hypothetical protein